ncbi:hypothetical protein BP5796_01816 [Coleophoma crateriformis]|uniref:Uncharacterized protein n=1 Tax=Coleophoma crateriformis TaxID=565419 RepID=A0A3D8T1H4_9HELO|nr:hypothetical protein BP5796_01816 [Coleophoma crateriformis]
MKRAYFRRAGAVRRFGSWTTAQSEAISMRAPLEQSSYPRTVQRALTVGPSDEGGRNQTNRIGDLRVKRRRLSQPRQLESGEAEEGPEERKRRRRRRRRKGGSAADNDDGDGTNSGIELAAQVGPFWTSSGRRVRRRCVREINMKLMMLQLAEGPHPP